MSRNDESTELMTQTRTETAERAAPRLVSPRRALDDLIEDAIREEREHPHQRQWAAGDLESSDGRMYVLGAADGPRLASATWLHPAVRPAS